jgi:hypothetical protein
LRLGARSKKKILKKPFLKLSNILELFTIGNFVGVVLRDMRGSVQPGGASWAVCGSEVLLHHTIFYICVVFLTAGFPPVLLRNGST